MPCGVARELVQCGQRAAMMRSAKQDAMPEEPQPAVESFGARNRFLKGGRKTVNVNPRTPEWAVRRSGLDDEQVLKAFPKHPGRIDGSWEPTVDQLRGSASKAHVGLSELFAGGIPNSAALSFLVESSRSSSLVGVMRKARSSLCSFTSFAALLFLGSAQATLPTTWKPARLWSASAALSLAAGFLFQRLSWRLIGRVAPPNGTPRSKACGWADKQNCTLLALRESKVESRADAWLRVEAPNSSLALATCETSPNGSRKAKTPNVCEGLGARRVLGFDFPRAELPLPEAAFEHAHPSIILKIEYI